MVSASPLVYEDVEKQAWQHIKSNARRFYRKLGMTYDEAIQEGRFSLFLGLKKYDQSRGDVVAFAFILIRRNFLKMLVDRKRQVRHPHAIVVDNKGAQRLVPISFITEKRDSDQSLEFWDYVSSAIYCGDASINELEGVSARLQAALVERLSESDLGVLMCRIDPPRGLRTIMCDHCAETPTIPMIGEYLGIGKNGVDWALGRIRKATLRLISYQFSELSDFTVVKMHARSRA